MKIFRKRSLLTALLLASCNFLSNANCISAATQESIEEQQVEEKISIYVDEVKIDEDDASYEDEFKQSVISHIKNKDISVETLSIEDCEKIASRFILIHEDIVDLYCYVEFGTVYAIIERGALIKGFEFEFEDSYGYLNEFLDSTLLYNTMEQFNLSKGNYVSEYRLSKLQKCFQDFMALNSYEGADNTNLKFSFLKHPPGGYFIKVVRTIDPDVLVSRDMFNIKCDINDLDEDIKQDVLDVAMSVPGGLMRFLPTKTLWLSSYVKSMNANIVPAVESLLTERGYINTKVVMYCEKGEIFIELELDNIIKDISYSVIEDSFSHLLGRKEQEELKEAFEFLQEDIDNDAYTFAEKVDIYIKCFNGYLESKNRVFYQVQLVMLECGSSSKAVFWITPGMKNLQVGNVYVQGATKLSNIDALIPYIGQSKDKPLSQKGLNNSEVNIKNMKFVQSCKLQPILNKNGTVDILCTVVEKGGSFAFPTIKVEPRGALLRLNLLLSSSADNILRSSNSLSFNIASANKTNYKWRFKGKGIGTVVSDVKNAFVEASKSHLNNISLNANFTTVKIFGHKNPTTVTTEAALDMRKLFSGQGLPVFEETAIGQSIGKNLSIGAIYNHKKLTTSAYVKISGNSSFKDKAGREIASYRRGFSCTALTGKGNLKSMNFKEAHFRFNLDNTFKKNKLGPFILKLTLCPRIICKNGNKLSSSVFGKGDSIIGDLPSKNIQKKAIEYLDSRGNKVDIPAKRKGLVNTDDHFLINFQAELIYPFGNLNKYDPSKHFSINVSQDFKCSNEKLGGGKGALSKYAACKIYGRCPIQILFITISLKIGTNLLPGNQPIYSLGGGDWMSIISSEEAIDSFFIMLDFDSFTLGA